MATPGEQGEFEITVHAAEAIVEVRYPARPTTASVERYVKQIRAEILGMRGRWRCLVDQTALTVMPQELTPIIAELNHWALEHGMSTTARVVKKSAITEMQVRRILRDGGITQGAGLYESRADAWRALIEADDSHPSHPRKEREAS